MKNGNKRSAATAILLFIAIIAAGGGLYMAQGPSIAQALCDKMGMTEMADNEGARNDAQRQYLRQEIDVACGEDIDESQQPADEETDTQTTTATSTSAAPAPAPAVVRPVEFLANRAPIQKDGVNS
ncbi:MAG: hypothetical protein EOO23_08805, partial [Comamonadaceae bacterium]